MRVYTLSREEKEKIIELLRGYLLKNEEVIFAYLHGSFTEDRPFRDVDIAVYVKGSVFPFYEEELEDELSRLIGLPVDVRTPNSAPVTFRFRAIGGSAPL